MECLDPSLILCCINDSHEGLQSHAGPGDYKELLLWGFGPALANGLDHNYFPLKEKAPCSEQFAVSQSSCPLSF